MYSNVIQFQLSAWKRLKSFAFPKKAHAAQSLNSFRRNSDGRIIMKCRGIVLWFNEKKQIGFIAHQNGEDLYFHQGDVQADEKEQIAAGNAVLFDIKSDEHALKAVEITLV
jgi:cold shock CspA family protein